MFDKAWSIFGFSSFRRVIFIALALIVATLGSVWTVFAITGTPIPVGDIRGPIGVAINNRPDGVFIYTAAILSGDVSIVEVGGPITVTHGFARPLFVAVNPETNKVYVTDEGTDKVTVIGSDHTIIADTGTALGIGADPHEIAVDSDGDNLVYVASRFAAGTGELAVIDGSTDQVTARVQLDCAGSSCHPRGIDVDEMHNFIYIGNSLGTMVEKWQGSDSPPYTPVHVANLTVAPGSPRGIAVDENRQEVYIAAKKDSVLGGASRLIRYDQNGVRSATPWYMDTNFTGIAVAPAEDPADVRIYITNWKTEGEVYVFNRALQLIDIYQSIDGRPLIGPRGIFFDELGSRDIFVSEYGNNNLVQFDLP